MMARSTRTRLLSRTALAFGWLAVAVVATVALAVDPSAPCNTVAVYSPCTQAGVLPPECSFWLKGKTKDERKTYCNSKTQKNREKGHFDKATVTDPDWNSMAVQWADDYCWKEYQCIYSELDGKCNQGEELVNYGDFPVYFDLECPEEMPITPLTK